MSASVTPTALSRLRWGARSTPALIRSDRIETPPKTKTPEVSLGGLSDLDLPCLDHRAPEVDDPQQQGQDQQAQDDYVVGERGEAGSRGRVHRGSERGV